MARIIRPFEVIAGYDRAAGVALVPPYLTKPERAAWLHDRGLLPMANSPMASPPGGPGAWSTYEMMQGWQNADAPAVTAASNNPLTQDAFTTLPANFFSFPGRACMIRTVGVLTTTGTPGTYTFLLKYGGSSGTTLATTGAIAPAAVTNTNTLWFSEWYIKARATGGTTTALTLTAYGSVWSPTWVVPTTQATWGVFYAPPNTGTPGTALADVASLDGTVAKALTLTVTPSVATGSIACRDCWVVATN